MSELPQRLLNGIVVGGIYALNVLGLTMIYGMMNVVNTATANYTCLAPSLPFSLPYIGVAVFSGRHRWRAAVHRFTFFKYTGRAGGHSDVASEVICNDGIGCGHCSDLSLS